jgi:hypothetical protein
LGWTISILYRVVQEALPKSREDRPGRRIEVQRSVWALVVHTCNPSYPEGRDQEDCGSNPPDKEFVIPYLKNTQHKTGLEERLK